MLTLTVCTWWLLSFIMAKCISELRFCCNFLLLSFIKDFVTFFYVFVQKSNAKKIKKRKYSCGESLKWFFQLFNYYVWPHSSLWTAKKMFYLGFLGLRVYRSLLKMLMNPYYHHSEQWNRGAYRSKGLKCFHIAIKILSTRVNHVRFKSAAEHGATYLTFLCLYQ